MAMRTTLGAALAAALLLGTAAAQPEPLTIDLKGRVQDHGDARVRVTVWHDDMERYRIEPLAEGFADQDGGFELRAVPWFRRQQWGMHQVVVVAGTKAKVGLCTLRGDDAATGDVRVELRDRVDVRGRLVDARSSQPIAGGSIWPSMFGLRNEVWLTQPLPQWRAESGADGAFVLRGLPSGVAIRAVAAGRDHARTWIDLPADGKVAFDVPLHEGGIVRGRVLLPDGAPAVRAEVMATGDSSYGQAYGSTLTDDDGRFELRALAEGSYKVWANAEDLTVIAVTGLQVQRDQPIEGQVVQLVRGGFIVGRIVDAETGKPFEPGPSTDVAMYGPARGDGGSCEATPVQPDGTFRIRAPAGDNLIYLRSARGYREPSEVVTVTEGQETVVTWRLEHPKPRKKNMTGAE